MSTQSSTPESDLAYPHLPPEILSEILSRLSVKLLLKFRCVSKSWRDLISSSEFVKMHLKVSNLRKDYVNHKILSIVVGVQSSLKQCSLQSVMNRSYMSDIEAFEVEYPMKSSHRSVRMIVGSCNGLVCVVIEENSLFILNPTTRKFKKVPDSGFESKQRFCFIYGFGYDVLNDDYKVVGIFSNFRSTSSSETQVMIYSLRSDSWRRVGDHKAWNILYRLGSTSWWRIRDLMGGILLNVASKYAKGRIHWAVCPDRVTSRWEIVSLDLSQEVFGKVRQPNFEEVLSELELGVVCGNLCVLCQYENNAMELWVLKEYGVVDSWTKMVSIPPLYGIENLSMMSPLCVANNGRAVLSFGTGIFIYDPKEVSLYNFYINNFGEVQPLSSETYVESLVSPISDAEAGREEQS